MTYWEKKGGGLLRIVLTVLTFFTLLNSVFTDEHDHLVSLN